MKQTESLTGNTPTPINLTPSSDPETIAMQKQLIQMQMLELQERLQEKEAKKADLLRFQLARKEEIRAKDAQELLAQNSCGHKKPNGYAALDGQKDSYGVTHLICNYCMKSFDGLENVPADLRRTLDSNRIGGPA